MENLISKFKEIIHSKKGETLIESILSILIFSVLILTLGTMTQTSLRITSGVIDQADELQEIVNKAIMEDYATSTVPTNPKVTFLDLDTGIKAEHEIILTEKEGIIAFKSKK